MINDESAIGLVEGTSGMFSINRELIDDETELNENVDDDFIAFEDEVEGINNKNKINTGMG